MEDHGFERNSDVQQKESCNECQFTCETKADLEKHTSEVHNKDCVLSRHAEGTDKSKNSVEEVKRMFFCPFQCGFSNEEEDLFLIHLTVNHEFSKQPPPQSNYKACHLCTFCCTTKTNWQNIHLKFTRMARKLTIHA